MISVEDARERILGFFSQLDAEERAISDALGQVLTEDIVGRFDVPPWDNSAMDGYALQAGDIENAHPDAPVTLNVIGSIAAGEIPSESVKQGAAIRIMTGAPLPDGADAVVPFEDTDEGERGMGGQTPGRDIGEDTRAVRAATSGLPVATLRQERRSSRLAPSCARPRSGCSRRLASGR